MPLTFLLPVSLPYAAAAFAFATLFLIIADADFHVDATNGIWHTRAAFMPPLPAAYFRLIAAADAAKMLRLLIFRFLCCCR